MRLSQPRIPPLADAEMSSDQAEVVRPMAERGPVLNIFRTLARKPKAATAFLAWGNYILSRRNSLAARERELAILRTGYLCKSGYEWTQHVPIGLRGGLTDAEVARIKAGPKAAGWSAADAALLVAVDDLHADQFIGETAWAALREHFSDEQAMDLVFTVGQYTQVSMMLNSFGVQLDSGQTLDPDLKGF